MKFRFTGWISRCRIGTYTAESELSCSSPLVKPDGKEPGFRCSCGRASSYPRLQHLLKEARIVLRAVLRTGLADYQTICSSWCSSGSDVLVKQRARVCSPTAGLISGSSSRSSDSMVSTGTLSRLLSLVSHAALELLDIHLKSMVAHGDVSSLLGAAARLAPDKLIVTFGTSMDYIVADELHCLPRTTSLQLTAQDLYITPPLLGEFTLLKSLFLHSYCIDLGDLLPVCPRLSILKISDYWGSDAITVHSSSLQDLCMDITGFDCEDGACIDIVAPVLKKVELEANHANMLIVSFLAPAVEELCWSLKYNSHHPYANFFMVTGEWCFGGIGVKFGGKQLPHINILRLDIHCTCIITEGAGERQSITEAIAQLPVTNFSVLVLYISAKSHVIGPPVSRILQILPAIQKLKLVMVCQTEEASCPYEQSESWRRDNISLTDLEVVEIIGLAGEDHELDLMEFIFRYAPALGTMSVTFREHISGLTVEKMAEKMFSISYLYPSVEFKIYV